MSEPIPLEEDILKTQLWKRIDILREAIESHKGEILYQFSNLSQQINTNVGHSTSEHSLLVDKKIKEINELLTVFRSKVQEDHKKLMEDVHGLMKEHTEYTETRFEDMKKEIDVAVTQEATSLFTSNEKRITAVEAKFADLSKSINNALSQYQTETRKKVGELLSKILKVTSKLKDGFQDL